MCTHTQYPIFTHIRQKRRRFFRDVHAHARAVHRLGNLVFLKETKGGDGGKQQFCDSMDGKSRKKSRKNGCEKTRCTNKETQTSCQNNNQLQYSGEILGNYGENRKKISDSFQTIEKKKIALRFEQECKCRKFTKTSAKLWESCMKSRELPKTIPKTLAIVTFE